MKLCNNIRGFSLVEVLVTAAILLVLSVIAVPQYFKYRNKSRRSQAYSTISNVANIENMQYSRKGKYFGFSGAADLRSARYIDSDKVFDACPADQRCSYYNYTVGNGFLLIMPNEYQSWRRLSSDDFAYNFSPSWSNESMNARGACGPLALDYDCFFITAEGDIDTDSNAPGGKKFSDLILYSSKTKETTIVCDDLDNSYSNTDCGYPM